jgi:sugar O-acyltransferase (sialic acid O-acetyltransferase NeuD family)
LKAVILYGGGGHARVILDCLQSAGAVVAGILDDNPALRIVANIPVIHSYQPDWFPELPFVLAVGDNATRKRLAQLVQHPFTKAIHASAIVSPFAQVHEGTVIFHRAVVQTGTVVGQHVILNTASVVEHDCTLANFVHIAPSATLCGGVSIGEGTLIGAGATVLPGVSVGKWCIIGAGAVVIRSIADFSVAVGVPARVMKRTDEP